MNLLHVIFVPYMPSFVLPSPITPYYGDTTADSSQYSAPLLGWSIYVCTVIASS